MQSIANESRSRIQQNAGVSVLLGVYFPPHIVMQLTHLIANRITMFAQEANIHSSRGGRCEHIAFE